MTLPRCEPYVVTKYRRELIACRNYRATQRRTLSRSCFLIVGAAQMEDDEKSVHADENTIFKCMQQLRVTDVERWHFHHVYDTLIVLYFQCRHYVTYYATSFAFNYRLRAFF